MVNIDKLVNDFSILPYDEQHEKVVFMLEGLQEAGDKFRELLTLIKTTAHVDASILLDVYTAVMLFGAEIQEAETNQAKDRFTQIKVRLQSIHDQEMQEKNDADDILNQL